MTVNIKVIGVDSPCPRCRRMYELTAEAASELGMQGNIEKIVYDSVNSKQYGRVGTAHDIAQWAEMDFDWSCIKNIVSEGWSRQLDDFLMPCKTKAEERGWLMTPVLIVNEKVAVMGYVPEKDEIKSFLSGDLKNEN